VQDAYRQHLQKEVRCNGLPSARETQLVAGCPLQEVSGSPWSMEGSRPAARCPVQHPPRLPFVRSSWLCTPQHSTGKLREGIVAASRNDAFSREIYETSVRLAIYARHDATLTTTCPSLVRHYHNPAWRRSLESRVATLSLADDLDNRCLYASLALLHATCNQASPRQFCPLWSDVTCEPAGLYQEPMVTLPASHPHLHLARRVFLAARRSDYAALRRTLRNEATHQLQRLLILQLVAKMQMTTWVVLSKAYTSLPREWLSQQLMLDLTEEPRAASDQLQSLLKALPWEAQSRDSDIIALRSKK
jgi:hypothetical protein